MAHVSQPDSRQGIMRAIGHALDMNQNGKLDAKEFEEFHRYLIGLATDNGTMEQYIAERADGSFDSARKFAGHPPDVDVHDNQKKREAIMTKVAADFATQLWQDGHIDDDVYVQEMEKLGIVPGGDGQPGNPTAIQRMPWIRNLSTSSRSETPKTVNRRGSEMTDLITAIAAVTRRPVDTIAEIMGNEAIDVGGARAGHEICERLSAAGFAVPLCRWRHSCQHWHRPRFGKLPPAAADQRVTRIPAIDSPQALVLTSDWTTKPPTRLYPMGNGPRIVHRVCVVAYVNGQVIDPRLPLRREELDKLEQIFAVLVFDGAYVDEVEAPPITDQPQPEMPPQIAALEDTPGYKPRKLRQRRTRRVAA